MTGADAQRAYAALYRPTLAEMGRQLPEWGEGLNTALHELHARPSPDRAERLGILLEGCLRHVRQYRAALLAEGESGAP